MRSIAVGLAGTLIAAAGAVGATATAAPPPSPPECQPTWKLVSTDEFRGAAALTRSQGATTDGQSWFFSWQGGLERTDNAFLTQAAGTWPADIAVQPQVNPDGSNHVGGNHIGDIDYYNGLIYAPIEDGGENAGVAQVNDPEYQHPYIAVYDARTLTYTGVSYALDKNIHEAGVPWVAVNSDRHEVYTAEWEMPHDRINVFDPQLHFERFLPLVYPSSLGADFHLSRIQGAKVYGNTLYATRDDSDKTVFSINLDTGVVTRLFALHPSVPAELEGLAVRPTSDGALLHVLIVLDNQEDPTDPDSANIHTAFENYAPVVSAGCGRNLG